MQIERGALGTNLNFVVIQMISLRKNTAIAQKNWKNTKINIFSRGSLVFFPLNFNPVTCSCNTASELILEGRSYTTKKTSRSPPSFSLFRRLWNFSIYKVANSLINFKNINITFKIKLPHFSTSVLWLYFPSEGRSSFVYNFPIGNPLLNSLRC